ncbi:MAG: peptidoglycan editing factor PgeF [Bacteroidaceae bacterium]|nr:peptidoglycan editing factor PgeF [Bacteroidaceae bacterium]
MSYLSYPFPEGITAFSTCRDGGVGEGAYTSFNCTHYCGDNPIHVATNRQRLCADWSIPFNRLIIPRQVHGTDVAVIDEAFLALPSTEQEQQLDGVDALISPLSEVCLAISTADCIPILLYDTRARIVAAIHAGWRGTVARIVSLTLSRMRELYGTRGVDVRAVIGPGISMDAFEVGDEVYDAFRQADFPMEHIARRYAKWHIDLWEANRLQLLDEGLLPESIEVANICTFQHVDRFFSARRLGILSGRILTAIMRRGK